MTILTSVYATGYEDEAYSILYQLLHEREPHESISHNGMPTWQQHHDFIKKSPYKKWFIIREEIDGKDISVGSIYVTYRNEIGIAIFKKYREKGFASAAINSIITMFPGEKLLANINPLNKKSINLFEKLGFTQLQVTYELQPEKVTT